MSRLYNIKVITGKEASNMKLKQTAATYVSDTEAKRIQKKLGLSISLQPPLIEGTLPKVFINIEDIWVDINLNDQTYCIGAAEG
jgi:hypothetical protein